MAQQVREKLNNLIVGIQEKIKKGKKWKGNKMS